MDAYTAALERHLIEVGPAGGAASGGHGVLWRRHPQLSGGEAAGEAAASREEALPHRPPMQRSRWRPTRTAPGTGRPCGRCGGRASTASPWGSSPRTTSVLRALGRIHTWQQVQEAVAACRRAKFPDVSLDLIYGLPGQTMEQWEETLSDAADPASRSICPATG